MESSTFFTKDNANKIRGLAALFMIIHHTFGFPERIMNVEYIPLLFNIEVYIAQFSRICVFMYLFLSGYGLCSYIIKNNGITYKYILKRVIKLLKIYWITMIIFLIIGSTLGIYTFNFREFIMNALTLSYSYNGEWWFMNTYIIIMIVFPIIYNLIKNKSSFVVFIVSFILSILSRLIYFIIPQVDNILIISMLRITLSYLVFFLIGYIFCKEKIFDNIHIYVKSKKLDKVIIQIIVLGACIVIRRITSITDIIVGPTTIYASLIIINKVKLNNMFSFIGNHSTNIWLTHSFFCYYYFQSISFSPKYVFLIIAWILALSLLSSYIINSINYIITKAIKNINKRVYKLNYN